MMHAQLLAMPVLAECTAQMIDDRVRAAFRKAGFDLLLAKLTLEQAVRELNEAAELCKQVATGDRNHA
jgi:hypothetical protein